jgi:hypothetical protein
MPALATGRVTAHLTAYYTDAGTISINISHFTHFGDPENLYLPFCGDFAAASTQKIMARVTQCHPASYCDVETLNPEL